MFDVGFWELLLIFGVGLMILGPERMPRVAAQVGPLDRPGAPNRPTSCAASSSASLSSTST